MSRPRVLDLFSGAGGAAMGYHRAGFDVVGVDIVRQKNYPFEFHQADAMTFPLEGFDAIHASPPCQAHTAMKTMWNAKEHADLLTPTRARLKKAGLPYVVENVVGAPMPGILVLCGSMFGLGTGNYELRRHRLFESSHLFFSPTCAHRSRPYVIGVYGDHGRDRRRGPEAAPYFTIEQCEEAMGIDWMGRGELMQAIPPAYTEWIGTQLLAAVLDLAS